MACVQLDPTLVRLPAFEMGPQGVSPFRAFWRLAML